MISSPEEYQWVDFANGSMSTEFFNGEIMPVRPYDKRNILKGEDIAFLYEYAGRMLKYLDGSQGGNTSRLLCALSQKLIPSKSISAYQFNRVISTLQYMISQYVGGGIRAGTISGTGTYHGFLKQSASIGRRQSKTIISASDVYNEYLDFYVLKDLEIPEVNSGDPVNTDEIYDIYQKISSLRPVIFTGPKTAAYPRESEFEVIDDSGYTEGMEFSTATQSPIKMRAYKDRYNRFVGFKSWYSRKFLIAKIPSAAKRVDIMIRKIDYGVSNLHPAFSLIHDITRFVTHEATSDGWYNLYINSTGLYYPISYALPILGINYNPVNADYSGTISSDITQSINPMFIIEVERPSELNWESNLTNGQ